MNEFYELVESTDDFIVIYKKPYTSFHSDDGNRGLFETVKQCENLSTLYPVHRLDKVTSGLLLMAKTATANQELLQQFKSRDIEKFYLAISGKKPKKKQGLVKGDMVSARRGAWKLLPTSINPAITQFFSTALGEGKRLFVVKPHTGQTHQIRVALKSAGAPIWGDSLYADAAACAGVDRAYLHAYSLAFSLDGKQYRFTEMPREGELFLSQSFLDTVTQYSEPWNLKWPTV